MNSPIPTNIVILRQPDRAEPLADVLRSEGCRVAVRPVTRTEFIHPRCSECWTKAIDLSDWIVFTSLNAVRSLAAGIAHEITLPDVLARRRVAVFGRASELALVELGVPPDVSVLTGTSDELALRLTDILPTGASILHPCARGAMAGWTTKLKNMGYRVRRLPCYRTQPIPLSERLPLHWKELDVAVVASPSGVRAVSLEPDLPRGLPFAAIGPTTGRSVREYGLNLLGIAESHSPSAMVQLILRTSNVPTQKPKREEAEEPCSAIKEI